MSVFGSDRLPNLAREPFSNDRPLVRLRNVLLVAGVLLAGTNAWIYWRSNVDTTAMEKEVAQLERQSATDRDAGSRLAAEIDREDLASLNERTSFLNARIAERVFSWNRLFDRMAEVVPRGVRVRALSPQTASRRLSAERAAKAARIDTIDLRIDGQAERTEDLLVFVDNLFAHPEFGSPNLLHESRRDTGVIDFELSAEYKPPIGPTTTAAETAAAGATGPTGAAALSSEAKPFARENPTGSSVPGSPSTERGAVNMAPTPIAPTPEPKSAREAARPHRAGAGLVPEGGARAPVSGRAAAASPSPEVQPVEPGNNPPGSSSSGAAGATAGSTSGAPGAVAPSISMPGGVFAPAGKQRPWSAQPVAPSVPTPLGGYASSPPHGGGR